MIWLLTGCHRKSIGLMTEVHHFNSCPGTAWARIEVMDLSRRYRAEVLRTGPNTNPRAITVEPYTRYVAGCVSECMCVSI